MFEQLLKRTADAEASENAPNRIVLKGRDLGADPPETYITPTDTPASPGIEHGCALAPGMLSTESESSVTEEEVQMALAVCLNRIPPGEVIEIEQEGSLTHDQMRAAERDTDDSRRITEIADQNVALTKDADRVTITIPRSLLRVLSVANKDVTGTSLIDNSPLAIIATDAKGLVTHINRRAQQILKYREAEALGIPVSQLYADPLEPRRIGKLLHQAQCDHLIGYETSVKSKDGEILAIRHASAFLYDDQGKRTGSVGYFELHGSSSADHLRELETAKHAAVVANLTAIGDLEATLRKIPEVTRQVVGCDAVVLYAYDPGRGKFAYPPTHSGVTYEKRAWPDDKMPPSSIVFTLMRGDGPFIAENVDQDPLLQGRRFSREEGVKSCVVLPLKALNQRVGVMFVNYRSEHRLGAAELNSISLFADQAAIAILNAQLYAQAKRRAEALAALNEAGRVVATSLNLEDTLRQLAKQGLEIVGCDEGGGCFSHVALLRGDILDFIAATSEDIIEYLQREVSPIDIKNPRGRLWVAGRCAKTGKTQVVPDVRQDPDYHKIRENVKSQLSIPLEVVDDNNRRRVIGVLSIEDPELNAFNEEDVRSVELLAAHAALAIRNSQLKTAVEGIARMTAIGNLEATLSAIPGVTRAVTGCDAVVLRAYDEATKQLAFPPTIDGVNDPRSIMRNKHVKKNSVVLKMLELKDIYIAERVDEDDLLRNTRFARQERIKSCVVIPLRVGERRVGVMFVNYRSMHRFTTEELNSIRLFADQAAVAISNAQALERSSRRAEALSALHEASQVITRSLDLKETLQQISQQALRIVGATGKKARSFSHMALVDEATLQFTEASSSDILEAMNLSPGIAGRAAATRETQNVPNVSKDDEYAMIRTYTKSQLSVPLKVVDENSEEKVIGVLTIESPETNAFGGEDLKNVELLARAAALAIENAKRYEELTKVRGLAWMGLTSATWRHTLANSAYSIRRYIGTIRHELARVPGSDSLATHVDAIERLAEQILEKPVTQPLTPGEGVGTVRINEMIKKHTVQLSRFFTRLSQILEFDLDQLDDSATARASEEWLRQVLDILVDNAIKATASISEAKIVIRTKRVNGRVEISVSDNGPGIPSDVKPRLFRERVLSGTGRTGMGLLIAQLVVQTYGGNMRCEDTERGTTMTVSLPLDSSVV